MADAGITKSSTSSVLSTAELLSVILENLDTMQDILLGARRVSSFWQSTVDTTPQLLHKTFRWHGEFETEHQTALLEPSAINFHTMSKPELFEFEEDLFYNHHSPTYFHLSNSSYQRFFENHACLTVWPILRNLNVYLNHSAPTPGQQDGEQNRIYLLPPIYSANSPKLWVNQPSASKSIFATRPPVKLLNICLARHILDERKCRAYNEVTEIVPDFLCIAKLFNEDGVNVDQVHQMFANLLKTNIWPERWVTDKEGDWLELAFDFVKKCQDGTIQLWWKCKLRSPCEYGRYER